MKKQKISTKGKSPKGAQIKFKKAHKQPSTTTGSTIGKEGHQLLSRTRRKPIKRDGKHRKTKHRSKHKTQNPQIDHESDSDSEASASEDSFEEVSAAETGLIQMGKDTDGFPSVCDVETEQQQTRSLIMQHNRKKKKSGGFQSMGLSHPIFKGIMKKGYKVPTPIQRKTIPLILDGKDVVAMARTGSGKTAAFLVPMFERLKAHSASGARALVLSPTRELALQTFKFTKELGRFAGMKATIILGGDSMEEQFAALHENPDILIATPGRFMHLLVEMELKLSSMEYVVFDEADRLFEMGFAEQLQEIVSRLPDARQTLLFSATLPRLLVEFARAGLNDPTLVRLDVDTKLSEQLKMSFLQCRSEDKTAVLLYLLRCVVKPSQQTVVFAATKHHVEYLNLILAEAGIHATYVYSSLDQTARKINVAKFRNKRCRVMVVTDLAARGIDIPMLDNVINYNFPAKAKLFVHRVGRVARAGRSGEAFSLIAPDEVPYVLDLHLFLGRSLKYAQSDTKANEDGVYGMVPQTVVDDEQQKVRVWQAKTDLLSMQSVISNAYKQYTRSRPPPSNESVRRAKDMSCIHVAMHPMFGTDQEPDQARNQLLDGMRSYRPNSTIFEINSTKKSDALTVMKRKRNLHTAVISANVRKMEETRDELKHKVQALGEAENDQSNDAELQDVFSSVVAPKRSDKVYQAKKKRKKENLGRDEEHYVAYKRSDDCSEKGLRLGTSFEKEAATAVMDMVGDENQKAREMDNQMKWDRKKKKFVREMGQELKKKKVKTESGHWIPASYKANVYKKWLEKSKAGDSEEEEEEEQPRFKRKGKFNRELKRKKGGGVGDAKFTDNKKSQRDSRSELKRPEQIMKHRKEKARIQNFQKKRAQERGKRRNFKGRRK